MRPHTRDRPARVAEPSQPVQQLDVLRQRDVIQESVAAIQIPRDAARLEVPGDALGRIEVERTVPIRAPRKRRHGEDTGEILQIDRPAFHPHRISRNADVVTVTEAGIRDAGSWIRLVISDQ